MICQHWIGTLRIAVKDQEVSEREVDLWLPDLPQPEAVKLDEDRWEDEVVFPGLLRARARIGPLRATATLNATFTGCIEYWRKQ